MEATEAAETELDSDDQVESAAQVAFVEKKEGTIMSGDKSQGAAVDWKKAAMRFHKKVKWLRAQQRRQEREKEQLICQLNQAQVVGAQWRDLMFFGIDFVAH